MSTSKWAVSFYWVLRIFLGVAAALIVVAFIYPPTVARGPAGPAGAPGKVGASGADGATGDRGRTGKDGDQGETGKTGATGANGKFWGK